MSTEKNRSIDGKFAGNGGLHFGRDHSYHPPVLRKLRPWGPLLLALSAAALYAWCWRAYYVGFFNDDAFFIIGARALAQGRFVELNDPRLPDLVNYLPGYPFLLAPLAALRPDGFVPFQSLSILMTAATVGLTFAWARDSFGEAVAVGAAVLVAFNPLTASLSGTVLSDIPYTFFNLLIVAAAWRGWERRDLAFWGGLGALSGFLFLLRPVGAALGAALVAALLIERRWKAAFSCGAAFAALALPYLIVVRLRQGFALAYGLEFLEPYRDPSSSGALAKNWRWNALFYFNELFARIWYRWPGTSFAEIRKWATIVIGAVLAAWGMRRWTSGAARMTVLYLAAYVAVHLSWSKQAGRYLLPVLPFLAAALMAGAAALGGRWRHAGRVPLAIALLSAVLCVRPVSKVVQASLSGEGPLNAPPRQTLDWVKRNTPEDALFGAEMDGSLHVLTGRHAIHLRKSNSPDLFMAWADGAGVDYVLVTSTRFSLKTRAGGRPNDPFDSSLLISLLEASPSFRRVFTNLGEGTAIYERVRPAQPATV